MELVKFGDLFPGNVFTIDGNAYAKVTGMCAILLDPNGDTNRKPTAFLHQIMVVRVADVIIRTRA